MQDKNDIEQLKASLSITNVAKALGLNVERGRCHCFYPQRHAHGDRTPSLSISEDRGLFRCFVCPDVRGDVIDLVQMLRDCSFSEAVHWLKEEFRPWLLTQPEPSGVLQHKMNVRKVSVKKEESSQIEKVHEIPEAHRMKVVLSFLKKLDPVDNTPAKNYLIKRRIFKPVWDKMRLRYLVDYEGVSLALIREFGLELLQAVGLFNEKGNLRYFKHRLIFPYLDREFRSLYFQSRTIEKDAKPKELNLRGRVPYPYNLSAFDEKPGWLYLCEGVIDTLTLIGRGLPAVGIPGVSSFKAEWVSYFKNKNVVLCLDQDEAGRNGTAVIQELLNASGIKNTVNGSLLLPERFRMKEGEDINDYFGGRH